jgi:DMSO/TMAO reductase YedYZ heme-binding membrane subunit
MLSVHRYLGALTVAFVAAHVASILVDSFVRFGVADVLVPFASSWHPVEVAWGIAGMYLLVAIEATSLARARISARVWRNIHVCSYVLLALVTVHLLTAGTDAQDLLPTASAVFVGIAAVFGAAMLLTWRTAPKVRPVTPVADAQAPVRP